MRDQRTPKDVCGEANSSPLLDLLTHAGGLGCVTMLHAVDAQLSGQVYKPFCSHILPSLSPGAERVWGKGGGLGGIRITAVL